MSRARPLSGVSVVIKGTNTGSTTNSDGNYSVRAAQGNVLQFRLIGTAPGRAHRRRRERHQRPAATVATSLDAVVVTALGQTTAQRALGTAQQTVSGQPIAQTQRENFVNALQGRVAGVDVTSTSGVPGASTSITIRGISSISSSNQPLMIVDGLPIDNKTTNTQTPGVRRADVRTGVQQPRRRLHESRGRHQPRGHRVDHGPQGPRGRGALRHRRGERRDRHHDEARPSGRQRVRLQQLHALRQTSREAGSAERVRAERRRQHVVPVLRRAISDRDEDLRQRRRASSRPAPTQKHNLSFTGGPQAVNYRFSASSTRAAGRDSRTRG